MISRVLNYLRVRASYLLIRAMHVLSFLLPIQKGIKSASVRRQADEIRQAGFRRILRIRTLEKIGATIFTPLTPRLPRRPISNPSIICLDNGEFLVTATEVNRLIDYDWGRRPRFISGDKFSSQILIAQGSLELLTSGMHSVSLDWRSLPGKQQPSNDMRVFCTSEGVQFVWNEVVQKSNGQELTTLATQSYSKALSSSASETSTLIESPMNQPVEKNWMPLVDSRRNLIEFVYSCSPLRVLRLLGTHEVEFLTFSEMEFGLSFMKGGTQLVHVGAGRFLSITHVTKLSPVRFYHHHAVIFEEDEGELKISSYSRPFVFRRNFGVEFATGLMVVGDLAHISFGDSDKEAIIASISMQDLLELGSELRP